MIDTLIGWILVTAHYSAGVVLVITLYREAPTA